MRYRIALVVLIAGLSAACGGTENLNGPSTVQAPATVNANDGGAAAGGTFRPLAECSGVTYVGPIRQPISVQGTTVNISWLGSDDVTRGYRWETQRYDVTNVWVPAKTGTATAPEVEIFFRTEGTYRFRVRGLFCNDGTGSFTDWVVFSTGDTEDHSVVTPPVVPPPPPPNDPPPTDDGNNGHGNDDDHDDDDSNPGPGGGDHGGPPPVFEDTVFCHAEFHKGHGGQHPVPDSYTYQTKTAHSQQELDQHISQHEHDYLGACE